MLMAVLAAGAVAAGIHPVTVGVAVLAATRPWLFLAGCAGWVGYAWFARRRAMPSPDDEARLLRSLAAELRSGASLRPALAESAHAAPTLDLSGPTRLAVAGMPMDLVADGVERSLPVNGRLAAAAFRLSSWSGARVAAVFESLASRAADAAELRREQRAATVQARLSAAIVGLAPLLLSLLLVSTGSIPVSGGVALAIVLVGIGLEVAGLVLVLAIIRKEER